MPSVELTRTSSQPSFKESCITAIVVVLSVESLFFVASPPSFGDVGESDFLAKTDKILWTPWLESFVPSVQLKMLKNRIQLQSKFRIFLLSPFLPNFFLCQDRDMVTFGDYIAPKIIIEKSSLSDK